MRAALIVPALLAATLAQSVPAIAAGPSLVTRLFVERAQPGQGLRLAPIPRRLHSGDHIVVVVAVPAGAGAHLVQPVPAALRFGGTLREPISVSVDGGLSFGPLATRTVSGGRGGARAAQADDVTHLRWTLTGAPARLSFRATVR